MLTREEKQAGRFFKGMAQGVLDERLAAESPTYVIPGCLGVLRHACPQKQNRSTALNLHEIYVISPSVSHWDIPAGRFGFIFREGRCRSCGQTALSKDGQIVDGYERPPQGRVVRLEDFQAA